MQSSTVHYIAAQCSAVENELECNSGRCNRVQWNYRCLSLPTSRDSVSPVCGIFSSTCQSPISKLFRFLESLGKSYAKKVVSDLTIFAAQKNVFFCSFWSVPLSQKGDNALSHSKSCHTVRALVHKIKYIYKCFGPPLKKKYF